MKRLLAVVGAGVLAGMAAAVAPPASPPVDVLIARLGSESFAEREAAAAALEAAGPAAIPALDAAARDPNPEVSRRAGEVLARLRRTTDSKDRLAAKKVKLAYKAVPLGTAVNELKARTGINLTLDPANVADPLRPVTCETGELPVWEAVATFCQAAGLKEIFAAELPVPKQEHTARARRTYYAPPPPPTPETMPVTLADGKYVALPGSRSTAVRVLALPASFPGHRVYLGTGDVLLHFDVAPVPGLHWRDVTGVRVTKLIDDAGRFGGGGTMKDSPPPVDGFDGVMMVRGGVVLRWDGDGPVTPSAYPNPRVIPVPVKVATPSARSLKLLEGAVICEVAVTNQPLVTIDDVVRSTGVAVEGTGRVKATIVEYQPPGKGGDSVLKVQVEAPAPWQARRRLNPWGPVWPDRGLEDTNRIKVLDAAGKMLTAGTTSTTQFGNDEFSITTVSQLTFRAGVPAKVVVVGSKPVAVEVPFRMENVPLP